MLWYQYLLSVLDIIIVAYVLYRVLLLVKGTRAMHIILGILILLAITFIATDVLYLRTLSWLLEKFWISAFIVIVIVFQPEIRSALAQLGSQRWLRFLIPPEPGFIYELLDAVGEMSKKKTGALIVLEQAIGLKNYIETGTTINAGISKELILSLFNHGSPLHDGAVIIRDGLLVAAGCVLPLTSETATVKNLGTRHRAAVGVSEISDAIVIIVSEQTGSISLATKGKIQKSLDLEQVKLILMNVFLKEKEQSFFSRFLKRK